MKLHRNLAFAVISALEAIFECGEVAEKTVEHAIALHPKWGRRDRAFFANTTYEIVRNKRLLAFAVRSEAPWALLLAQLTRSEFVVPPWPEFADYDTAQIRETLARHDLPFALRYSLPEWLDERGRQELGATRWETEIAALHGIAAVVVRANTLQIARDALQIALREAQIESVTVEAAPDALILSGRPFLKPFVNAGLLEVQDVSSQLVAPFLGAKNGETVLDLCAGAGGKTLHLAALASAAQIVALDVSHERLGQLQRRAQRNGAHNIEIRPLKSTVLEIWKAKADRVLIDAPCSGTGTLRRQSSLKWRLTPDFLREIIVLQREILGNGRALLKPNGVLVYATCSIFPCENQDQIAWFLAENSDFSLEESCIISPAQSGFDGFFMARLRKRAN